MVRLSYLAALFGLLLFNCILANTSEAGAASVRGGHSPTQARTGVASFYGDELRGRRTASGRRFDDRAFTAASLTLPLNSKAEVTSLRTGLSVIVTITDRGPFTKARVIDLSKAAAEEIGITAREGLGMVVVRPVRPANAIGHRS